MRGGFSGMKEVTLWTLHLLAALVVLVVGGYHMASTHLHGLLGGEDPLGWASVLQRSKSGLHFALYWLLLGAVLYHGLYGLRNLLAELGIKAGRALVLIGLGAFLWGGYVLLRAFLL